LKVEKGWLGFSEVNRVVYDPEKINPEQMEQRLQESGTYIRTVSGSLKEGGREDVQD